jgi:hypothetical protein
MEYGWQKELNAFSAIHIIPKKASLVIPLINTQI